MTTIHLVVAPASLAGVRDALRDWSAEGLVDAFAWSDGHDATVVDGGGARRRSIPELLASTRATTVVLTALGAAVDGAEHVDAGVVGDCEQRIERALGDATTLVRIRATAIVADSDATVDVVATAGWHNVVLAAEQARDPGSARMMVDGAVGPDDLDVHVAAGLAGVLGLWAGVGETVFGDVAAPQSPSASIARSYVRALDSSRAERELRAEVLSTRDGLPLPRVPGGAEFLDDAPHATATMEAALWRQHPGMLQSQRTPHAASTAQHVGVGEALRMFFGFLVAAFRNTPRAWVASAIRSTRAGVAGAMQRAIFGTHDPAYRVAVGGVLPDGRIASWSDVSIAIDRLAATGGPLGQSAREDLAPFWRAYVHASLTLCDAGERDRGLPPIEVGARKGVLRRREDAVPGPQDRFADLSPRLASIVGDADVPAYDVSRADLLERTLVEHAGQPGSELDASASLDALRRWRDRRSHAFAVRVGTAISRRLTSVRAEIADLVSRLHRFDDDEVDERLARAQRRLVVALRIIAGVAVVVLVATGVCMGFEWVELVDGLTVLGCTLLAWLVASFVAFVIGQSALFRLIHERRELAARREVDEQNLHEALRDARRLSDGYAQFLRWSEIVGAVLADPYRAAEHVDATSPTPVSGLPRSVVIGEARVPASDLELVAADLRRLTFEPGWLGEVFDVVLRNAHRRLGKRGVELRDAPELLFRERGDGEHTVLPDVARDVVAQGVDAEAGDVRWSATLEFLAEHPTMTQRLLQRVVADGRDMSIAEFTAGIEGRGDVAGQTIEDSAIRHEIRVESGRSAVVASDPVVVEHGLSRLVVLRQRTRGLPDYELTAYAPPVAPWSTEAATTPTFPVL